MTARDTISHGNRLPVWLIVGLSLLLHIFVLMCLTFILDFEIPEPEKLHEVVLRQDEKENEPPEAPAVPEPPPEEPLKRPRRMKRPSPQAAKEPVASNQKAPVNAEPIEPPSVEPSVSPEQESEGPPPPRVALSPDWNAMERALGPELSHEHERYAKESLLRRRSGPGYGKIAAKVKTAIRRNKGWVQPGNQMPLGPKKRIFHSYLEVVHDKIHMIFAHSFLGSLSNFSPSHPLSDFSLNSKVEFEILANGNISEVRLVRTSGNMVFDAAAVDAIYRSGPHRPPPSSILSYNDRVYIRWGFHRNQRKCGVFNAEPFILRAPGASPEPIPHDKMRIIDG